jgi:ankyrin repeat protein
MNSYHWGRGSVKKIRQLFFLLMLGNPCGVCDSVLCAMDHDDHHVLDKYGKIDLSSLLFSTSLPMLLGANGSPIINNMLDATTLILTVSCGDIDDLVQLIMARADLNAQDENFGLTALIAAAELCSIEKCQRLIAAHARLDIQDARGDTALIVAAVLGNKKLVKHLTEARADLNIYNKKGKTALFYALDSGRGDIAKLLLEARADPQMHDETGLTTLMVAVFECRTDTVRHLIDTIKSYDAARIECLIESWPAAPYEICRLIGTFDNFLDVQDSSGRSAIVLAKKLNRADVVQLLVAAGADTSSQNGQDTRETM